MDGPIPPQATLPAAHSVRVVGNTIHIAELTIDDECAADLIRRGAERGAAPTTTIEHIVATGARVIDQAGAGVQVDYVRTAFEATSAEVAKRLEEGAARAASDLTAELARLFDPERGELIQMLGRHAGTLEQALTTTLGDDSTSGVQHRIEQRVAAALERSQATLLAHLSSADGSNPLADFKAGIGRLIQEATRRQEEAAGQVAEGLTQVRTSLAELNGAKAAAAEAEVAISAERARGTAKGFTHEDRVHQMLSAIADAHGDVAHDVSDLPSAGGRKTGDTLVEIDAANGPPEGRIVVEAKDERLSWAKAAKELGIAMAEREADYAIFVVASEERVPVGCLPLQEYLGNRLIVALSGSDLDTEVLRLAYRYARVRTRMIRSAAGRLDAAAVREAAQAASLALAGVRSISSALTGASKQVEAAKTGLADLVAAVGSQIARIEALVQPSKAERQAA